MTTQDERLAAVERFQQQVAAHIRELNENATITLGLIQNMNLDIKRILARQDAHTGILNEHSGLLTQHSQLLNEHSGILHQHTAILHEHSGILNEHTALLQAILARLSEQSSS